jgi:hypothetical protein
VTAAGTKADARRRAVEAFIAAHYDVSCDAAQELDWFEQRPHYARDIVAVLGADTLDSLTAERRELRRVLEKSARQFHEFYRPERSFEECRNAACIEAHAALSEGGSK